MSLPDWTLQRSGNPPEKPALRVGLLPQGHRWLLQRIQGELASAQDQLRCINKLQHDTDQVDSHLAAMVKQDQHMQALQAIPGIVPLTATAQVSIAIDLNSLGSARQFAAWLGLTQRQTGTGGKTYSWVVPSEEPLCADHADA